MSQLEWESFTKKIYIKSKVENLYTLWTSSEGLTKWFLRDAEFKSSGGQVRQVSELTQQGDFYIWKWHNWDGQEEGQVLQANGKDYIEITFSSCKVSVHLESKNNKTLVTLRQFEIPTDSKSRLEIHQGCSNGWTFWLANLKAYVEYGVLLNETEEDLRNISLSGYQFVNM